MESLGELLPLLIFILIPIIRGLNKSKKQKYEYKKTKDATNFPYQQSKSSSVKPWKSIIDEVGKEIKGALETETNPVKKIEPRVKQGIKGKGEASPNMVRVEPYQHFEGKQIEINDGEIIDSLEKDKAIKDLKEKESMVTSLKFSSNPIVQGLIFSEILGPPKSKR